MYLLPAVHTDKTLIPSASKSRFSSTDPPPDTAIWPADDEHTRRRRYEALVQTAVDKAYEADKTGTERARLAARSALDAALAARASADAAIRAPGLSPPVLSTPPESVSSTAPVPLQCQYCGKDLAIEPHGRVCRVVVEVDPLDIPAFLRRGKPETGHG